MPRGTVSHTSADTATPKNIDAIGIETGSLPDDSVGPSEIAGAPTAGAFVQTFATADKTHATRTSLAAPAGGVGDAAGGWDTGANRDLAIASINAIRADLADTAELLNALIDDLQTLGFIS